MPTKPVTPCRPYEDRFNKFCRSFEPFNTWSQFGEDAIIKAMLDRIGASNKWCLEVGAHNGIFFSNTRRLILEESWGAVLIEADDEQFHHLAKEYQDNERVFTVHRRIDQHSTIDSIIDILGVHPGMDLMIIDIDGQDYWMLHDLRATPRILMVEFDPNPKLDRFIPERDGEGQAGEQAIRDLLELKNYIPVCGTLVNCVAVRWDLAEKLDAANWPI